MKNYIGFVNDHSGSMIPLANAATKDYNTTITAIKDAASREMLDTVVSVVGIGLGAGVERQVVISNPHVLKPVTSWPCPGGTPLYDGIADIIDLFKSLPDASNANVSFLIIVTTDGEEAHSRKHNLASIKRLIAEVQDTGRYTIVFRVPKGARGTVSNLGVPAGNIQEWETTVAGMAASTQATTAAVDTYFATRSAGAKSSNVFYASGTGISATAVAATLKDIQNDVSLYVVPTHLNGVEIRQFILTKRMAYLKGAAFYQLTKTEPRVSETKLIAIRNRNTGAIYSGKEARILIGLPTSGNARVHPAGSGDFDIFIQSESTNRKLVGGTGVMYWEAIGKPFGPDDEAYLKPKAAVPVAPAVVVLPSVAPTNKPTKSPIPVTKAVPATPQPITPSDGGRARYHTPCQGAQFHGTRELARAMALVQGKKSYDAGPHAARGYRFYVA